MADHTQAVGVAVDAVERATTEVGGGRLLVKRQNADPFVELITSTEDISVRCFLISA